MGEPEPLDESLYHWLARNRLERREMTHQDSPFVEYYQDAYPGFWTSVVALDWKKAFTGGDTELEDYFALMNDSWESLTITYPRIAGLANFILSDPKTAKDSDNVVSP